MGIEPGMRLAVRPRRKRTGRLLMLRELPTTFSHPALFQNQVPTSCYASPSYPIMSCPRGDPRPVSYTTLPAVPALIDVIRLNHYSSPNRTRADSSALDHPCVRQHRP
jgi:hypothetical protein